MSDEERQQRQMEFILDQQAQLTEKMLQADKRMGRLERVVKLMIRVGRREQRDWREHYNALVDAQMRTETLTQRNSENISQVSADVGRVSTDISRLERIVEQLVTSRNGGTDGVNGS